MLPVLLVTASLSALPGPSAFEQREEELVHESLAASPVSASLAGYHRHEDPATHRVEELDAELDDFSPRAIEARRRFDLAWQERLKREAAGGKLGPEDSADLRLILDHLGLELLELERIQRYRHDPTYYVELVGDALFVPLSVAYAPKETRLRHVLSRLSQVPRLLDQARAALADADAIYVKVAVEENEGNVDLIRSVLPRAFSGSPSKAQLDRLAPTAIAALQAFSTWVQEDLGKRPGPRSWRLGRELYGEKFRAVMEANLTPEQVLTDAEQELERVRSEMLTLALPLHRQLYPHHSDHADLAVHERQNAVIGEVLRRLSDEHASRDGFLEAVEANLAEARTFIRARRIVSLSRRDNLKVIPTPEFERGIYSVAGFRNPPPLDPDTEAQFWVTPIDPSLPAAKAESKLREYNRWVVQWLVVHEALPGHYIQFEHANDLQPPVRRLVRALYSSTPYVEGWAEYVAQVLLREGFAGGDARYRLSYLKIWLRAVVNAILDVRLQTRGMTDRDALALMEKEAFQTEAEAEGKLQRAKLEAAQLPTYFVGTREWWRLRRAYEAAHASDFNLSAFHDRALGEGGVALADLWGLLGLRPP